MDKIKDVEFKVVGTTFRNDDGTSRKEIIVNRLSSDDTVTLKREPDNKYDRYAVAVMTEYGQIGYVGKEYARILAEYMDNGRTFISRIIDCGEYKDRPYCKIIVNEI